MAQSTKLFLVLGFMFLLFTTMNGHLAQYIGILFGKKNVNPPSQNVLSSFGITIPNFTTPFANNIGSALQNKIDSVLPKFGN